MKVQDIRLGQTVTLTGEVHTLSALGLGDDLLPDNQIMVTMLVTLDSESPFPTTR